MDNKYKDEIKYAVVYSMITDLFEEGVFDRTMAEKINKKCAELLGCREMEIE